MSYDAEAERIEASWLSNDDLAKSLIGIIQTVNSSEDESANSKNDELSFRRERGVLREAAFRLAGIREIEPS